MITKNETKELAVLIRAKHLLAVLIRAKHFLNQKMKLAMRLFVQNNPNMLKNPRKIKMVNFWSVRKFLEFTTIQKAKMMSFTS